MRKMKGTRPGRLMWGVIFLVATVCVMATLPLTRFLEAEERNVNQAVVSNIESSTIPAIDEAAPAVVETASFGLG